jgi:hypothetical protein
MSNTKKTIQINPELFKIPGGAKTRKAREKKEAPVLTPMISPNNLKNKLLKRIKDHKLKETGSKNSSPSASKKSKVSSETVVNNYSDEFYGAMNYLSDLSKKQKRETEREKSRENLHSRTVKNHSSMLLSSASSYSPSLSSLSMMQNISLELPPELQVNSFIPDSNPMMSLNNSGSANANDVPYGCLKNGSKPTYRDWIKTRKNHEFPELNARPPTPPKRNTFLEGANPILPTTSVLEPSLLKTSTTLSREQRLEQIKSKLKKIQDQEIQNNPEASKLSSNLKMLEAITPESEKKVVLPGLPEIDDIKIDKALDIGLDVSQVINEIKEKEESVPKQYLKRTVRRKFTLGKSDKLRKVAVLLKDKQTRKNVMDVQHELKKTSMKDVRKYLRQHGIIKIGSVAPNDILRKTFETAMLSGEITNTNKDTLLHNFLNEDLTENS